MLQNQMLCPQTDMLGLPSMDNPQATQEKLIKYYEGQIHQAMEFLPTDHIIEIVKKEPSCVNEKGICIQFKQI